MCYTEAVLKCFNNITDKSICSFTKFDIKEFYPSITEGILDQTLEFSKQHTNIDKNDLRLISYCCKSLIFSDNYTWKKKSTSSCFDVTMGSFDGSEICELVGLCIQPKLEKILLKSKSQMTSSSNHPPNVIKEIPNSIEKRLPKNLPNEDIFNTAKFQS